MISATSLETYRISSPAEHTPAACGLYEMHSELLKVSLYFIFLITTNVMTKLRQKRKKRKEKKEKRRKVGIEAIVEPGGGGLYIRGTWMKKLKDLDKKKMKLEKRKTKHI